MCVCICVCVCACACACACVCVCVCVCVYRGVHSHLPGRPRLVENSSGGVKFCFYQSGWQPLISCALHSNYFTWMSDSWSVLKRTYWSINSLKFSKNKVILFLVSMQFSLLFIGMCAHTYHVCAIVQKKNLKFKENIVMYPQFSNYLLQAGRGQLSNVLAGSLSGLTCPTGLCLKPVSVHPWCESERDRDRERERQRGRGRESQRGQRVCVHARAWNCVSLLNV